MQRVVVSRVQMDTSDKWCPQGSVFRPLLFKVFIDDNFGIECTLSRFTDDAELCGTAGTPEGWDAIQRDKPEKWNITGMGISCHLTRPSARSYT